MEQKRAIIPNSFTMMNMILGFIAIIYASRGTPKDLAIGGALIFVASFFDFIDGAAARALGVDSQMGLHLDSLADAVAYGIAPGFIAYQAFLSGLPEIAFGINWGMLIAPIFPICATYRLARFNIEDSSPSEFKGLPSPAAGIFISSIPVLAFSKVPFLGKIDVNIPIDVFIAIFALTALLMISGIDYSKIVSKVVKKGKKTIVISSILVILLLFYFNMWTVFVLTGGYIIAGIVLYSIRALKKQGTEK
ncbi:MAG: CDP-alcohol phosphatidyltransferase family protein [Leptospirales bacterium]|nr:CDP-alcohol phosphatidyltransferase family protein [Leptospirales bacterium]